MVGNKFLSPGDIDLLLNQVLQNYNCFTVKYSVKVAIISLAELMSYSQQPYIVNRLPYLLDTLLCLMQTYIDQAELFENDVDINAVRFFVESINNNDIVSRKIDNVRVFQGK